MDRSDNFGMINRTRTNWYYVRKIAFVSTKYLPVGRKWCTLNFTLKYAIVKVLA